MAVRFGIIFISDSIDDYKAKQLRSILERKKECNFIWFNESSAIIHNTPKVFEGESFFDHLSQLAIKVPRKSLENDELPNTKKNIFNGLIRTIYGCIDDENSFLLENDKTIKDLNIQDLLGPLKTQVFPLSDIITDAINQKEKGVVLDYALINDIKYNLLDNTFHFIFDVGNPLLEESSQLIVEMPREALDLKNADRLVEHTLSPYNNYSQGSLVYHISEGSYIIHLIDD